MTVPVEDDAPDAESEVGHTPALQSTSGPLGPVGQVLIVARYELVAMLLSVRAILFATVYGGATFSLGAAYTWAVNQAREQLIQAGKLGAGADAVFDDPRLRDEIAKKLTPAAEWLGGQPLVDAITHGDLPWVVLVVLMFSTFVVPGLVLLVGYDRISDDVSTRFSRYVLLRVRRGSYLAGKVLGHWGAAWLVVVAVHLVLVLVGSGKAGLEPAQLAAVLPRIWLAMAIFLLAYATFCALLSSSISPPFAVFAIGGIALMMCWFASFSDLGRVVWMGNWDMRLFLLDPAAVGVFGAYTAVFAGLAFARIRTRDI